MTAQLVAALLVLDALALAAIVAGLAAIGRKASDEATRVDRRTFARGVLVGVPVGLVVAALGWAAVVLSRMTL